MKRKKLTIILLGLMLLVTGVLTGCQIKTTMLDENYKEAGYYKVTLYYNGGIRDGAYYHDRFVPHDARFPYPGGSGSPINSPTRSAHVLDGWYLLNQDYFKSREVNRVSTVVDEYGNRIEKNLYYQDGSPVIDIQWYIEGFDYVNASKNGQKTISSAILEDPEQDYLLKKWNFEIDRVFDDIVLVPLWKSVREYTFIPDDDTKLLDPDDPFFDREINGGSYDYTFPMRSDGSIRRPSDKDMPIPKGLQVEGLYLDDRFLEEVPFNSAGLYYPPETYNDDGSIKRFPIYLKFIDEMLEIIDGSFPRATINGKSVYMPRSGYGLYLKSNIDLQGGELNLRTNTSLTPITFSQFIYGNGYTISNFVINIYQDINPSVSSYGAIFENIFEANISNITFDRVKVNFNRQSGQSYLNTTSVMIYTLAKDLSTSNITNVNITNMSIYDVPALPMMSFEFDGEGSNSELVKYYPDLDKWLAEYQGSLLSSYAFVDEDIWDTRLALEIRQNGDFSAISSLATGSADARIETWQSDFKRTITRGYQYYNLPNYGTIIADGRTYKFYGWVDAKGFRYDNHYVEIQEGVDIEIFPMFYQ